MVTLFSGTTSSSTSTLEPVTGIRDLTIESKSSYNNHLKEYEDNIKYDGEDDLFENLSKFKSLNNKTVESDEVEKEIIYNPDNLREKSNLSREQIYDLLDGSDLQVLADSYYDMENEYNVNAIFLMALNIEESGHGKSELALLNNNIGGVKSSSGGWETFNDWSHSLEYIASLIDEMYLSEDGAYYNGESIYDVNIRYCEGNQWAHNLNTIAMELLERANSIETNNI